MLPALLNNSIHYWAHVLFKLIISYISSSNGISLIIKCPYGKIMLNVSQPTVLTKYYGREVECISSGLIVKRYTYGHCSTKTSVGTDIIFVVTKPSNINIDNMSEYLTVLFSKYQTELEFLNIHFTQQFNHCVKLMYYSDKRLKEESSLGFHCNFLYDENSCYLPDQN